MKFVRHITILIVLIGSMAFAQTASAPKPGGSSKPGAVVQPADTLIDINHATTAELRTLPGIGEAYSAAIIRRRPYKNKTQLRSMGVIPPAAYLKIKDKIIAKQ